MKLLSISGKHLYLFLRVLLGIIFITHGAARLFYGSVSDFGHFLNETGFMVGLLLAWIVTIGEIISGSLLALGTKARYAVIFHAVIILTGIVLVHLSEGWFVVGHGRNGVEYSLLILAVLAFIYHREGGQSSLLQSKFDSAKKEL